MGLSGGPTNIFNALSSLSQGMQLRLHILALSGDSPVSNAFTEEADRLGLTVRGRERKERDAQRYVAEQMEAIRERAAEFSKRLDVLDQASAHALFENEDKLRMARKELKRVQNRAYEITMPDGTIAKVYRDGEIVRDDDGTIVDTIKPDELPASAPTWAERKAYGDAVEGLQSEQAEIIKYRDKLARTRHRLTSGEDLSAEEMSELEADAARMPDTVRRSAGEESPARTANEPPGARAEGSLSTSVSPTRSFNAALQPKTIDHALDDDILRMPPSASVPSPR